MTIFTCTLFGASLPKMLLGAMRFLHHFLGIPVPNIVITLSLIRTKPVSLIIDSHPFHR